MTTETHNHDGDTLTIDEVAAMYRVSRRTVERWIARGLLPAHKLPSGTVRIIRTDAEGAPTPAVVGSPSSPEGDPTEGRAA